MIPTHMAAVQLMDHGGTDKLVYRTDIPVPSPGEAEVLVQVTATAKNNTDRKVREGLYPIDDNSKITSFQMSGEATLRFPRIQGADVVGQVVQAGPGVSPERIGERGLLDFNIYRTQNDHMNLTPDYYGHGRDGGYAEYIAVPSEQFHAVSDPELSDPELAAMGMCSYQTALRMLNAAEVQPGEHILITGASGGVGTALIQLCRMRGAVPHCISSPGKADALRELGAASVLERTGVTNWLAAIRQATGGVIIDAVMDLVGGEMTNVLLESMIDRMSERSTYPRYSIAGASGGNISTLLWTRIYLYQIQIYGVSHGTRAEADQLINWIRNRQLRPVLHGCFRLSDIHRAEEYFVNRASNYLGKIVIVPDSQWDRHGRKWDIRTGDA